MYKSIRIIRIVVALAALLAPTVALVGGWDSVFSRMQIVPAIIAGAAIWLVVWIAVTFVCGRIYCSTVCPLGTLQDCVAAFRRMIPARRGCRPRGYRYHAPCNRLRLTVVVVVVSCMVCGWMLIPMLLDPYGAYARIVGQFVTAPLTGGGPAVPFAFATFAPAVTAAALVVGMSWRRGRLLCNTICPVGALLGGISERAVLHADINTDKCINCGECSRVCKAECIDLTRHIVDASRCVVCFKCMGVCPNDAITYRAGRHRLAMPLMQPTPSARMAAPHTENFSTDETISPTTQRHP